MKCVMAYATLAVSVAKVRGWSQKRREQFVMLLRISCEVFRSADAGFWSKRWSS